MRHFQNIIIYDGLCNLCFMSVKFIRKYDVRKRFNYIPLQSEEGQQYLLNEGFTLNDMQEVIYIKEGKCYSGSTALLEIFKDMGGLWKLLFVFSLIPRFIRDFIYNRIAKNRYLLFGKCDNCIIPSRDTLDSKNTRSI